MDRRSGAMHAESVTPPGQPVHPSLLELWQERETVEDELRAALMPPKPPERPARRRRPGWVWAIAAAVAVVVVGGAAFVLLRHTTSWPAKWDPRVAPIAAFDESQRNLRFHHPVPVVFLDDAAFTKRVTGSTPPSAADRTDAQQTVEMLRALGLASGSPDLVSNGRAFVGNDIVGFYDSRAKKVWVRGDSMTPYVQVTLAHELTHVLQDQNFGLRESDDDQSDAAYTALVEADAVRIQDLYLKSLSVADQHAYAQTDASLSDAAQPAASALPAVLIDSTDFPYRIGPYFLEALIAANGTRAIDDALRSPPTATIQILEPSRYLGGASIVAVPAPTLAAGEHKLGVTPPAGAFDLFEVLADHLPIGPAWAGARTWAGDAGVVYRANGRTCVRLDVATDGDNATLLSALRNWIAAGHNGTATPIGANMVRLDACDPGATAAATPAPAIGALDALEMRGALGKELTAADSLSTARADCVTDIVVELASTDGLQKLSGLSGKAAVAFGEELGTRARPLIDANCPS